MFRHSGRELIVLKLKSVVLLLACALLVPTPWEYSNLRASTTTVRCPLPDPSINGWNLRPPRSLSPPSVYLFQFKQKPQARPRDQISPLTDGRLEARASPHNSPTHHLTRLLHAFPYLHINIHIIIFLVAHRLLRLLRFLCNL